MATPSGATPVYGFPYLLETDVPDIATETQLLAEAVEVELEAIQVPVGGIIDWGSATPPAGFLMLHGGTQLVATYPKLAAVYPGWVSGSNINIPDTRDAFIIGAGGAHAALATGGSATVSLVTGNIPQFVGVSVSITDPHHSHGVQPTVNGGQGGPGSNIIWINASSADATNIGAVGGQQMTFTSLDHVSTDSQPTGISGTVTFGSATPTPVNITPPFVAFHKIVRAQ